MRRLIIICMAMMLFFSASALGNDDIQSYGLRVRLSSQEPDPAQPGQYVDLRFKVENIATTDIEEAEVELIPEYPFSLDIDEPSLKDIGFVRNRNWGDSGINVKWRVRIADDAVQGENKIKVRYRSGESDWITKEFDVAIKISDATISIDSVASDNEILTPGESEKIRIKIKNLAGTSFRDVALKLDLTLSSLISATTTTSAAASSTSTSTLDLIPLAPKDSATEQKVSILGSGQEMEFEYNLYVYPTATPNIYKVPVVLTFYDELGTEYTQSDLIGLKIGSPPSLDANLEENTLKKEGDKGTVSLKFVNKGITDVKFLSVQLKETSQYEILSPEKFYIGNLDSDDYEIAEFEIEMKEGIDGEIRMPVVYDYKDPLNKRYSYNTEFDFRIYSKEEASKRGIGQGTSSTNIIVIAVIGVIALIIIFLIIRSVMKKK